MKYFVHQNALCETDAVGDGTRVWAFAHILPKAKIGKDCNVCDHVFIENDVVVGDRVTIKCGVQLWDGVRVANDVFIGPNATFTNDHFPRSKKYPAKFLGTTICNSASIGANATILPGLTIGESSMVGAGAVVTRSVPPFAIVVGNPAKIIGYVDSPQVLRKDGGNVRAESEGIIHTNVRGVTLHTLRVVPDMRGSLSVGEFDRDIPFKPLRYFLVFDVPTRETRGEHAHRRCHQFLIAIRGSVSVVADDGRKRQEVTLDKSNFGIHLPPLTWGIQYRYSSDAVLLVFASEYYDASDYIRSYSEFLTVVN